MRPVALVGLLSACGVDIAGPALLDACVPDAPATAETRTLFLNRRGADLRPGADDARTGASGVVAQAVEYPAWDASEADWAEVMACFRGIWAPFDVNVTDERPDPSVPYAEGMFGGTPRSIGLDAGYGGLAPFRSDCGTVERAIVFVFVENLGRSAHSVCEVAAQEFGHIYGLDHALDAGDVMSWLPEVEPRRFLDRDLPCGEATARACACGAETQNSHRTLLRRLGPAL